MWYHPAAFFLTKRDVIGAWLICLALATAFFGYPAVTAALDIVGWEPRHHDCLSQVRELVGFKRSAGYLACNNGCHPRS